MFQMIKALETQLSLRVVEKNLLIVPDIRYNKAKLGKNLRLRPTKFEDHGSGSFEESYPRKSKIPLG